MATAVAEAWSREEGDILVFLPGAAEIRRMMARLTDGGSGEKADLLPLYGDLPAEAQDRAIQPSRPGRRKVVLATSIAETSLTIEGIRVVIDSGVMRVPRYSARLGMGHLVTVPVTRASAVQRAGRAGRLAPGVCYRLWTEPEQLQLAPHGVPEILSADLSALALELAAWGVDDATSLAWLDAPQPAALSQARELLRQLGALDRDGRITPHGRRMAELPAHPRIAHLLLRGAELGHGTLACNLAALLGDRDILYSGGVPRDADVRLRLEVLREGRAGTHGIGGLIGDASVDRGRVRRALAGAQVWRKRLRLPAPETDGEAAGLLVARSPRVRDANAGTAPDARSHATAEGSADARTAPPAG